MPKINWSICFAIAFVWFSTQFGGGFASGRQIIDYYIAFGWYAIFTPILAQAIMALLFYYVLRQSFRKQLRNYGEFTRDLYGKTSKYMSPLFEGLYNLTLCIATAVAFATGGSTLTQLTGVPYIVSTLLIAVILFVLTIFGYKLVQKAASIISILIVVGMFAVLVPNLIYFAPQFGENYAALEASTKPVGDALWRMLLYVAFQIPALGAYVVHAKSFSSEAEVAWSMTIGFAVNSVMIMLTCLGMIAIYTVEGAMTLPVPILVLVQQGVGAVVLTPIISLLIFLGALSTGVTFVYGIVNRIVDYVGRNEAESVQQSKQRSRSMLFSLFYIVLTFSIAQFGLIPLVAKGYAYCGYIALFVVVLPILIKWIGTSLSGNKTA